MRTDGTGSGTTYEDHRWWLAHQPFWPEEWRLEGEHVPRESRWSWGRFDVHLDRLDATGRSPRATVLLLHGGGGNGRALMPLGRALAAAGLDVVAPDLPGYGLTRGQGDVLPTYDLWQTWVRHWPRTSGEGVRSSRSWSWA